MKKNKSMLEKLSVDSMGKLNMSKEKYFMMFSFNNYYGVLKKTGTEYDIFNLNKHECMSQEDLLQDLLLQIRTGNQCLKKNDVICMRINGNISCFSFLGFRKRYSPDPVRSCFVETVNPLDDEREWFIKKIHDENLVLSVLDGNVYAAEDLIGKSYCFYAIDSEVFRTNQNGMTFSTYSLFKLSDSGIETENLYSKPFYMVKNALYCFMQNKNEGKKPVLLLNRHELEMLLDYQQLQKLVV